MGALFVTVTIMTSTRTYEKNIENEHFDDVDFYAMQEICEENNKAVFKALKEGDSETLKKLMTNSENLDSVLEFADWSKLDFKKATSYGAGSLSTEADKSGKVDINGKYAVKAGDGEYVLFIETLTSRWGRKNEGVSAIAVCSYEHYYEMYSTWNGEKDDSTALAGELFWQKQRKD